MANLALLPQKVAALDAQGAHTVAGDLNNQLSPLVKMVADVDLTRSLRCSRSCRTRPATLSLLHWSRRFWQTSTSSSSPIWPARFRKLPGPQWKSYCRHPVSCPNPRGAAAAMAELVPVGLDLASVSVNMLSGQATTISPALLGKPTAAATRPTREQSGDLPYQCQITDKDGQTHKAELTSHRLWQRDSTSRRSSRPELQLTRRRQRRAQCHQWIGDWLNLQINGTT